MSIATVSTCPSFSVPPFGNKTRRKLITYLPLLLLGTIGLSISEISALANGTPPALMLAKSYRPGVLLQDYWISEKYDGVRGYWNGERLLTRGGQTVAAPAWFTAGWPKIPMDGELWAGRGRFAQAVATIRQQIPLDDAWRAMRFMVFDLPAQGGAFTERIPVLNGVISRIDQPWVNAVSQFKLGSHSILQTLLLKTVKEGGEGLMLHRGESLYKGVRNDDLLKIKTHEDAEARVVAIVPGKGKYANVAGALIVEMLDELPSNKFKLGTGFSDEERRHPPAIGSTITYRFRGLNDSGIPRFASFLRIQDGL